MPRVLRESHYKRTRTEPTDLEEAMYRHGISNDFWYRDGEPVVDAFVSAGEISTEIAKAIQEILEGRHGSWDDYQMQNETEFDSESYYEESATGTGEWSKLWSTFERELKESSRFFSNKARETLNADFEGIGTHRTQNDEPVMVEAGPDKSINSLFRARVFHDGDKVDKALEHPDTEIGPPPARLATAGRMNPTGIAVFYGALEKRAALAEVRPVVGSTVVLGQFRLLRDIRLLDLALLSEVRVRGSIFDPEYLRVLQRAKFLGVLGSKMVEPVMPGDQAIDYLPTQAVCDYLAAQKDLSLDGIIYKSVQAGDDAKNIILFHHASRVLEVPVPDGAKVSASLSRMSDDENDVEYQVTVMLTAEDAASQGTDNDHLDFKQQHARYLEDQRKADETRAPTLGVDLDSLEVHHVSSVLVKTSEFRVSRHTFSDRLRKKMTASPPEQEIDYSDLL